MQLELPYTIAFCLRGDEVLMVHRVKSPNAGKWNGIGGKILDGESPDACIRRELLEETGIDHALAHSIRFTGVVSWNNDDTHTSRKGMYCYVIELPENVVDWHELDTREGVLAWKPVEWVNDKSNDALVSNIPWFLPDHIEHDEQSHFKCYYDAFELRRVEKHEWIQ